MPSPNRLRKEIPLRDRDGSVVAYALVDVDDYDWLMQWRWSLSPRGCAYRRGQVEKKQIEIKMHRLLMGNPQQQVDHINGNPLDNRRENLRLATCAQNNQNRDPRGHGSSGYRGVSFQKDIGRWRAQHTLHRKKHHIGTFGTAEEAAVAAAAWREKNMPFSSEAPRAHA